MKKIILYSLIGLTFSIGLTFLPALQARAYFGVGYGYGWPYYGGYWGYRPWYGYYPYSRPTYIVERPIYIESKSSVQPVTITSKPKEQTQQNFWVLSNKTGLDLTIQAGEISRPLSKGEQKKLYREQDQTIKITGQGKTYSFNNVLDNNVDIIVGKDGNIEIESWN